MMCESFETFGNWSGDFGDLCISNGAFVMSKYKPDKSVSLKKKKKKTYYWDYDNVKLDSVKCVFGDNESEILKMFQKDVIDIVPHSVIDSPSYEHPVGDLQNLVPEKEMKSALCFGCVVIVGHIEI